MNAKEITKNKVIAKLLKGGLNENDVIKMINKNFDYVYKTYNSVKIMAECLVSLH